MQNNIDKASTAKKFGADYIKGAKEALKQWDFNKDGKTSSSEMHKELTSTYSSIFKGNEGLMQKANGLVTKQSGIFDKYAGDDGVLDEYEYSEAINSDEYGKTLDEYWKMNAQNKFGQKYIDGLQSYTKEKDVDGDGKTTVEDMYKSQLELNKALFSHDPRLMAKGQELAEKYKQAWQLFTNSDGSIKGYNAALALNSDTFKELNAEYTKLHDQAMYYFEGKEMNAIDAANIPDGKLTKGEVKVSNSEFYNKLDKKEGSDGKMQEITAKEETLIDKFSGDDGVFSAEEYHQYKNSDEYRELQIQLSKIVE